MISYRINTGHIPLNGWVHSPRGAAATSGEACHIYDLFTYLTGSRVAGVEARSVRPSTGFYASRDNFVATIGFEDGSVASLTYTAMGELRPPEGANGDLRGREGPRPRQLPAALHPRLPGKGANAACQQKGHREELEAFADSIRKGGDWPSPLWQQLQAMEIAFRVEAALKGSEAPAEEEEG